MGDKATARRLAAGSRRADGAGLARARSRTRTRRCAVAEGIGFPVIIKATAGGGGKGMRIAQDAEQFAQLFGLAQNEALAAFGNGVGLRREVPRSSRATSRSRSWATRYGKVVHLGERDCSVQRRHQKLIEESPSPALDRRAARAGWARRRCALASNIGYVGAGTIEFLLDTDGSFYFMEMNTRIQVEHPVTEMVTSFDLVKEQIRVAAGEPLSFQGDGAPAARPRHRVPDQRGGSRTANFQPVPGLITAYHPPGGPGVRVDTHVYAGYTVPPYYDSLLAKVIVHGNDREEALTRMGQALDSFILEGVTTTIPFLARVIRHPDFVAGRGGHPVPRARVAPAPTRRMRLDVAFTPAGLTLAGGRRAGRCSSSTSSAPPPRCAPRCTTAPGRSSRWPPPRRRCGWRRRIGSDDVLLAGERNCVRIPGFHLGNSPLEMTEAAVRGKTLVVTTTNGTKALLACQGAAAVLSHLRPVNLSARGGAGARGAGADRRRC